jgi:hypothetical protein
MRTLSFENLDFSFLIDPENKIAYLQQWEDGNWGEPDRYALPQALDSLPKISKLSRAIKAFRRDSEYQALCAAIEHGLERAPSAEPRSVWSGLAARIADFIYA